jgi:hypothetical protein
VTCFVVSFGRRFLVRPPHGLGPMKPFVQRPLPLTLAQPCSIVHPSRRSDLQRRHSRLSCNEDLQLQLHPESVHRPGHHPISTGSQIPACSTFVGRPARRCVRRIQSPCRTRRTTSPAAGRPHQEHQKSARRCPREIWKWAPDSFRPQVYPTHGEPPRSQLIIHVDSTFCCIWR